MLAKSKHQKQKLFFFSSKDKQICVIIVWFIENDLFPAVVFC